MRSIVHSRSHDDEKNDEHADPVLGALVTALGDDRASAEPLELALYARDAGVSRGRALAVCWPRSTEEVAAAVRVACEHGRPFVARGSGTGLAGGATPLDDPVVIVTTEMNRVLEVDAEHRVAWVEPGVLNLDLSRAVAPLGLHYAPDPSSQQACTIGGNVGTNAGGPHCLSEGVTSAHVLAVDAVLADGSVARLGGLGPDAPGYDLRGCFVGSEGTMGIATRIAVRLTPDAPRVATMLAAFSSVDDAAATVSGIIAAGVLPAALEMMDAKITRAVEDFVDAGYPRDAEAVLLVELEGLDAGVEEQIAEVDAIARTNGAASVRVAADDTERALLWKGRKSAFGAIARIAPDYYLHDAVVPRTQLVAVLRRVYEIAAAHELIVMNVFHAGDGNLHPLLVFDGREPGVWDRVYAAGNEILGVVPRRRWRAHRRARRGHREARPDGAAVLGRRSRRAGARARRVRPRRSRQPTEGLAAGKPVWRDAAGPGGNVDLAQLDAPVVTPVGARTQWDVGGPAPRDAAEVRAPAGIVAYEPADMTITVGAGTTFADLDAALAEHGQECPLDPRSPDATIGGILACGLSGVRRARYGPVRDQVLEVRFVTGDGHLVKGGGPTVKNVTGYDLPRLFVGSFGTLGVLMQATLRCRPRPRRSRWFAGNGAGARYRPAAHLFDGRARTCAARRARCGDHVAERRAHRGRRARFAGRPAPRTHLRRPRASAGARRGAPELVALVCRARCRHCARRDRFAARVRARACPRAGARRLDAARSRRPARRRRLRLPAPECRTHAADQARVRPRGEVEPGKAAAVVSTPLGLDPDALNACVACGLCLPHCPTYRVTGREFASPRGRIAAMRAVEHDGAPIDPAFRRAMDECVECRGCEAACPSAVPFGKLMEQTRAALPPDPSRPRRIIAWFAYRVVLPRHALLVAMTWVAWLGQRLRLVPARLGLPRLSARSLRTPLDVPVGGTPDAWLFTGCVMDAWFRDTHRSAARVMEAAGARVARPGRGGDCCGALHLHAGRAGEARALARRVMASMPGNAPVVVDSAGCGAALKEYGELLGTPDAHAFSARVHDFARVARAAAAAPPARHRSDDRRAGPVSPPPRPARARRRAPRAGAGLPARGNGRRRAVLRRRRRVRSHAARPVGAHPRSQGRGAARGCARR